MNEFDLKRDYHSYANTDQVKVTHLELALSINFEKRQLCGHVLLSLKQQTATFAKQVILDTRNLYIEKIEDDKGCDLDYVLATPEASLGSKLIIETPELIQQIKITYHTSSEAEGLQWLTPLQTHGKVLPYLFSQSQPINARSWIPLQDSPKARVTFNAKITAPQGMRVVMSADNNVLSKLDGEFKFTMPEAIPTHLMAIACGDLAFQSLGSSTGVYTEPAMLKSAAREFEDTQKMVEIAESLLGPYRWGRYDMIVLPPSFPFGGMENPRLAFMTPTLIAGDKSLVSTVAHELAHSWTGNLVSNATWRDLWLNEGFTTYFTNRIVEAVYGKEMAELELVLEYGRLKHAMQTTALSQQTVTANVQNEDPNHAFNRFTYDKASMFVHDLEHRLGRDEFDKFLFMYIEEFAFKAITTEDFVEYANRTLLSQHEDKISKTEFLEWIYGTGMPAWFVAPQSSSLDKVISSQSKWLKDGDCTRFDVTSWNVHHWLYFITTLPDELSQSQLHELDQCFNFTQSLNAEIACAWFLVAIRNDYQVAMPAIENYLKYIGRGKFVKPLYSMLIAQGYQKLASDIYEQAKPGYHPSIVSQLDSILT